MLPTNTNFDAKHSVDNKVPMYLVHFDGESTDYCNYTPGSPDNTCKEYLKNISGLAQKVTPEEGRASIGGVKLSILDYNDEITALLATDSYYFHRKKTTIKAGYAGMDEADMLSIFTGWVTGYKLSNDGLIYEVDVTDPQKWMQRKVFRSATDASTVFLSGNPLNILLEVLTSTGDGTNGNYDCRAAGVGLGLDTDFINVTEIETVRDDWFPGDSHYMQFTITDSQVAKDFIEKEICKVLNIYPVIDGQGRFSVKPYKPPIAARDVVQSFDRDNMVGIPRWDANLQALGNEFEAHYDWDHVDGEYDTEELFIDSTSLNNRGPGKKPILMKSKGLHTDFGAASITARATDIVLARKVSAFGRWATPPIKINAKTWFSRYLSEAGDVVPLTDAILPDIENGSRGLSEERLEIINRTVDWKKGQVSIEFLNTGFDKGKYGAISPSMTVLSGASGTQFTVSTADAAKYANYTSPKVNIYDAGMRMQASNITLLTINTDTGVITCDDIGATPVAGWLITFSTYDNCTDEQKRYSFIADSGNKLGSSNDDANLISP